MSNQPSVWVNATKFGEITGFTRRQAELFRKKNEGKGIFRRVGNGHFEYNMFKIPESMIIKKLETV